MSELVQCSRCLATQEADISETIAITCHFCGETDAAITEDFI
jgi:ribosomal protein S27E